MTQIKKIDNMLELLATDVLLKPSANDWQIMDALAKKYPDLKDQMFFGSDLLGTLDKLVRDGNVKVKRVRVIGDNLVVYPVKEKRYSITFEGNLFYLNGGYTKKMQRDAISTNLQSLQTWAISFGTVFAAIGTTGLLIFEYLKYNKIYPFGIHSLHKFFFGTLLGVCLLIIPILVILYILIRNRLKNKVQT